MKERAVPGMFGKAKPLPGQQGYKVKESERLEHEALQMEAQLKQVKVSMAQQQAQREKDHSKMKGGNRWRSAREDRGSVRQYAQDVKTKVPSKAKKASKKGESGGQLTASRCVVADWTVPQVTEWLASIRLGHLASTFEFNEVNGAVVLDLTPADLDYLQVTESSERKALLQQIEQLKRSSSSGRGGIATNNQQNHVQQREVVDNKLHDAPLALPPKKVAHWSQLTPLAESGTGRPSGEVPVNLADGDFNEDDSHASFLKALLDWRASDQQRADEGAKDGDDDTLFWTNPLADIAPTPPLLGGKLLSGDFDEEQSHANFLQALQAWRGNDPPANQHRPEQATASTGSPVEAKASCWQCYRLYKAGCVVQDEVSKHAFCSRPCLDKYLKEYARFYRSVADIVV
ncbi:hypothetical protein H310_07513 [Aphanomyces invadans]|uniref:SAM domain-containing protein n=1 Tax=Aphanomyces invadans TaxID=157072 RepID=A0A024U2F6_9STRA|nr:hypothetical protein H310_07513 [Aphanomyces invadans]ETW00087.1 hypothetical protein H310_07513 [Aphanomyces invadans]|eukprot:XP_008871112.1 hypothetical protein H310_07513 [Aphanomyces invadans]